MQREAEEMRSSNKKISEKPPTRTTPAEPRMNDEKTPSRHVRAPGMDSLHPPLLETMGTEETQLEKNASLREGFEALGASHMAPSQEIPREENFSAALGAEEEAMEKGLQAFQTSPPPPPAPPAPPAPPLSHSTQRQHITPDRPPGNEKITPVTTPPPAPPPVEVAAGKPPQPVVQESRPVRENPEGHEPTVGVPTRRSEVIRKHWTALRFSMRDTWKRKDLKMTKKMKESLRLIRSEAKETRRGMKVVRARYQ